MRPRKRRLPWRWNKCLCVRRHSRSCGAIRWGRSRLRGNRHGPEATNASKSRCPRHRPRTPVAKTRDLAVAESRYQDATIMCSTKSTEHRKPKTRPGETTATTHNSELHITNAVADLRFVRSVAPTERKSRVCVSSAQTLSRMCQNTTPIDPPRGILCRLPLGVPT